MADFLQALHSGRVLLMDGAMGTELQCVGIGDNECYELWNLTHPEQVRAIHHSYLSAGAECLVTNTFQANVVALARHGLQDQLEEITAAGVRLARSACGIHQAVLASIGPIPFARNWQADFGRLLHSFGAADGLLLETWSLRCLERLTPARQALDELIRNDGLPVLLSMSYSHDDLARSRRGEPLLGAPFQDFGSVALWARRHGFAAVGVNCGLHLDLESVTEIVKQYRAATDLPILARPNAGSPPRHCEGWVYPHTPARMVTELPALLAAGVNLVGGCCGTTPEHIAAFRPIITDWNARST